MVFIKNEQISVFEKCVEVLVFLFVVIYFADISYKFWSLYESGNYYEVRSLRLITYLRDFAGYSLVGIFFLCSVNWKWVISLGGISCLLLIQAFKSEFAIFYGLKFLLPVLIFFVPINFISLSDEFINKIKIIFKVLLMSHLLIQIINLFVGVGHPLVFNFLTSRAVGLEYSPSASAVVSICFFLIYFILFKVKTFEALIVTWISVTLTSSILGIVILSFLTISFGFKFFSKKQWTIIGVMVFVSILYVNHSRSISGGEEYLSVTTNGRISILKTEIVAENVDKKTHFFYDYFGKFTSSNSTNTESTFNTLFVNLNLYSLIIVLLWILICIYFEYIESKDYYSSGLFFINNVFLLAFTTIIISEMILPFLCIYVSKLLVRTYKLDAVTC